MIPILLTLTVALPPTAPLDLDRMLYAIRSVEDPSGDPRAIGLHGERGLYQFKRETWEQTTRIPFDKAFVPGYATPVARARLLEIKHELLQQGIAVTPYNVALCWRVGIDGAILRTHQPKQIRDYAQRAENLYCDR
jgi:hypothetical protein